MRKVTKEEALRWTRLARQYGFTNEQGEFQLGRYVIEGEAEGTFVKFITPVPAGLYTEELKKKTPPILFDRTANGEIILPGRWWQLMFDKVSQDSEAPAHVRQIAALATRSVSVSDAFLPPEFETISILAPDDDGNLVVHEALPPETRIPLNAAPK